ncbi:MAG TPA: GDP-mannose 4,6-dehydratase [Acidobacteriaceae bacterium]|nr:GDP-mannose 4,6-dehydratase [Acidobacteriaceae bacterium]
MSSETSPVSPAPMPERSLYVTGVGGFVGQHLAHMAATGVFGECELHSMPVRLDIRDADGLRASIAAVKPDWVIHLAARSFVPDSFVNPRDTFDVNVLGTLNLLCALRDEGFTGRLLYVSSGDVYGSVPEDALPVSEQHPAAPRNPYAVSKLSAETLCRQWYFSEKMDVVIARPFNHIGPAQDSRFVVPGFARQICRIAAGKQEARMVVGDLDVSRDFSDVRDVVWAYAALLREGKPGTVYNVSSGREVLVRSILRQLCDLAGVDPAIDEDQARLRPNEQRRMVASSERLQRDTGWKPQISLEASLVQILEHFRMNERP